MATLSVEVFLATAAWLDELRYRVTAGMAITEELHVVEKIVKALEDALEEPPDSLSDRSPRPSFTRLTVQQRVNENS